jgi:hypothetical protein
MPNRTEARPHRETTATAPVLDSTQNALRRRTKSAACANARFHEADFRVARQNEAARAADAAAWVMSAVVVLTIS